MADPRVHDGDILAFTAPVGGVAGGVPEIVGGLVVVPNIDALEDERYAGEIEGVYVLTKATGFALAEGEAIYWDDTAKSVKAAAPGFALIGHCATKDGVLSAATSVKVRLQQSPVDTPSAGAAPAIVAIPDPGNAGAIPVTEFNGYCELETAGAETRTLVDPTAISQRLRLHLNQDGGDCVITAANGVNQAGATAITFGDAGDFLQLTGIRSGDALRWRVSANEGVGLV